MIEEREIVVAGTKEFDRYSVSTTNKYLEAVSTSIQEKAKSMSNDTSQMKNTLGQIRDGFYSNLREALRTHKEEEITQDSNSEIFQGFFHTLLFYEVANALAEEKKLMCYDPEMVREKLLKN